MKKMLVVLGFGVLFLSLPVQAQDQEAMTLTQQSGCFACHHVGQKLVGPSFKEVANKYKGADEAKVNELSQKILKGGSGVWGQVPMRAHPELTEEKAKQMVKWILTLAE